MKNGITLPFPIYQVDAFTDVPFKGNPAGVCFLTENRADPWMQAIAMEKNLSETAFFRPLESGDWQLRWFTPQVEVDLCGHATLATAHILWTTDLADPAEEVRFHTRSGVLKARRDGEWIVLDFPAVPMVASPLPDGLADALGAVPLWYGSNGMDLMVELGNEETVRSLQPDLAALATLPARGVIVTARCGSITGIDFVSRFFAPAVGIPEDPVTGSAHCALAPYWASKLGKTKLVGYQASGRGGTVGVESDAAGGRVFLKGKAVTLFQGVITGEALSGQD